MVGATGFTGGGGNPGGRGSWMQVSLLCSMLCLCGMAVAPDVGSLKSVHLVITLIS